jgi:hypothetical protein
MWKPYHVQHVQVNVRASRFKNLGFDLDSCGFARARAIERVRIL